MMNYTHTWKTFPNGVKRVLTLPDWTSFAVDTIIPELTPLLLEGRALADEIAAKPIPAFHDLVTRFENLGEEISLIYGPLSHLKSVEKKTYPGIEEVHQEATQLLTDYGTDISLHEGLYKALVRYAESAEFAALGHKEQYLITHSIKDFELAGVALPPEKKVELKRLNTEGADLGVTFSAHVQDSSDVWEKIVTDVTLLAGIPEDDLEAMAESAKVKGKTGWRITMQVPVYIAVVTYADNRELRKEVYRAFNNRATVLPDGDAKFDNAPVMAALLKNADESAKLLGYPTYADYSLVKKMAASVGVEGVRDFNQKLAALARPKAEAELHAIETFAKDKLGLDTFEVWDFAYVEEKMRQELYQLDSEAVRKYFPYTKVMQGFAALLKSVFGVTLVENTNASVWHPTVKVYDLFDDTGVQRGTFYADMFAREGKKDGAWMDVLIASRKLGDGTVIPVAYLNCNGRMSVGGKEAYLLHDDVVTLFHEAGHTLHHVLGLSEYQEQSMEHVEWDTVELPSQLLENWTWEPEMLRLMSAHEDTGEVIPDDVIERMIAAKNFNTGMISLRQFLYGAFDWELYSRYDPASPVDPNVLWRDMVKRIDVRPLDATTHFPNAFSHIFAGGYSAGYFSYMWALGLAADAYLPFKEAGDIFSRVVGDRLLREIIAPGSERPMAESFEAYRGRKLDPKALAIHLALIEN